MTNLELYNEAFMTSLEIDVNELETASTDTVDRWDSIGHMSLIAVLEDSFGIELDPEDMSAINSYTSGKEILKKYNIEF